VALVDVQPQKQLGKGSIALAKGLNINANAKRGQTDERIVRYVFCQGAVTHGRAATILLTTRAQSKASGGLKPFAATA
jgi:hypothetical protein